MHADLRQGIYGGEARKGEQQKVKDELSGVWLFAHAATVPPISIL
ncbi:hypothetical protein OA002_02560 [bacterium]|nr:hypothetical protein [bacterium]